ncbi:hypothetical protein, partial [Cloacibacillus porcorum]
RGFIWLSDFRDAVQERAPLRAKSKAKALFIPCTVEAKSLFISSPTRRKSVLQNSHDSRKIGAKKCRRLDKPVSEYRSRIVHTVIARQCSRHQAGTFSNYPYCRSMRMRLPQDTQRPAYDAYGAYSRRF